MRRLDSQFDRGDVWDNYDDGETIINGHVVQPIHDISTDSRLQYFMNRQFAEVRKARNSSDTRFVLRRSSNQERKVLTASKENCPWMMTLGS